MRKAFLIVTAMAVSSFALSVDDAGSTRVQGKGGQVIIINNGCCGDDDGSGGGQGNVISVNGKDGVVELGLDDLPDVKAELDNKIEDAPHDGKRYARKDGGWEEVVTPSITGGLPDYSRTDNTNKFTSVSGSPQETNYWTVEKAGWCECFAASATSTQIVLIYVYSYQNNHVLCVGTGYGRTAALFPVRKGDRVIARLSGSGATFISGQYSCHYIPLAED